MGPFGVSVGGWHLDWQVSSMAQILNPLSQVFSPVECLNLIDGDYAMF